MSVQFLELSHFSLSLSFLDIEFSWSTFEGCGILGFLEQEGKEREGKHKRTLGSTTTTGFSCRYRVVCMFSLLILACMWFIGHCLSLTWRIPWVDRNNKNNKTQHKQTACVIRCLFFVCYVLFCSVLFCSGVLFLASQATSRHGLT